MRCLLPPVPLSLPPHLPSPSPGCSVTGGDQKEVTVAPTLLLQVLTVLVGKPQTHIDYHLLRLPEQYLCIFLSSFVENISHEIKTKFPEIQRFHRHWYCKRAIFHCNKVSLSALRFSDSSAVFLDVNCAETPLKQNNKNKTKKQHGGVDRLEAMLELIASFCLASLCFQIQPVLIAVCQRENGKIQLLKEKKLICFYFQAVFHILSSESDLISLSCRSVTEGEIGKDVLTSYRHSWSDHKHLAQPDTAVISVIGSRHNQVTEIPPRCRLFFSVAESLTLMNFNCKSVQINLFPKLIVLKDLLCVWHSLSVHETT